MKTLFIDGPARGELRDIGLHSTEVVLERTSVLTEPTEWVYHVHHFRLLNRVIRIASIQLDIQKIKDNDVFEMIASDKAKDAAE